jgi:putative (di)nucleoside polyphosphate hydrolase
MYRELGEEIGLNPEDVDLLSCTRDWLRYRLPRKYIRRGRKPVCIGQKQIWYLLRLTSGDSHVRLDASDHPEFDRWRWVDYWYPLRQVVHFKRWVYRHALEEFAPLLDIPAAPPKGERTQSRVGVKAQR